MKNTHVNCSEILSIFETVFEIYRNGSHLWHVSCQACDFRPHFALVLLVVFVSGVYFPNPRYWLWIINNRIQTEFMILLRKGIHTSIVLNEINGHVAGHEMWWCRLKQKHIFWNNRVFAVASVPNLPFCFSGLGLIFLLQLRSLQCF